jgi:hypothetical protein
MSATFGRSADPAANLADIRARLKRAAAEAGRDGDQIVVAAVAKGRPAERILPLLEVGHRVFAENRVQEALAKWPSLRAQFPAVHLRLVGPLQTNKVKEAIGLFDAIESLDRERLARALAAAAEKQNRRPSLFVQVNTGEEPQKGGVVPSQADAFIRRCREVFGLTIAGLMCLPPLDEAPVPHFALLAKIAARNAVPGLSMGMSGDFETAVRLGATHVRIGTAIFGPRA